MNIPHGIPAQKFIDWVNFYTQDESKRCRILLAEILLRMENEAGKSKLTEIDSDADKFNAVMKQTCVHGFMIKACKYGCFEQETEKTLNENNYFRHRKGCIWQDDPQHMHLVPIDCEVPKK